MAKRKSGNPAKAAAEAALEKRRNTLPVATKDHLQKKKPATATLRIVLDSDLAEAVETAEADLEVARRTGALDPEVEKAEAAYAEAVEAAEGASVQIVLKAIGRKRFKELEAEHPARPEDDEEHRELTKDPNDPNSKGQPAPYNPETFAPALFAETVTSPKMTAEEWAETTDEWTENEFMVLWIATQSVNSVTRVDFWGKG